MNNMQEREVAVSEFYTIEPSEAFQGIEEGLVRVIERGAIAESSYKSDIEEYALVCVEEDCTADSIWVAYQYTNSGSYADIAVLPESVFLDHATLY